MSRIKVATFNLFNRMGEWKRRAPLVIDQLLALAPDVIGLQEIDLMLDQGNWLNRETNTRLGDQAPYRIKHAAGPGVMAAVHGIATMARIDCLEHAVLDLMSFERVAQRFVFRAGEKTFVFVNTHLHHPPEAADERVRELRYLLGWLDAHRQALPTLVAGDFNSYGHEEAVSLMKGRFRSAYEAVHGREPEKTWPTPVNKWDRSPPGTLDYIYVSPEFRVVEAGLAFDTPSPEDPELYPSDHLGVFAVIEL